MNGDSLNPNESLNPIRVLQLEEALGTGLKSSLLKLNDRELSQPDVHA